MGGVGDILGRPKVATADLAPSTVQAAPQNMSESGSRAAQRGRPAAGSRTCWAAGCPTETAPRAGGAEPTWSRRDSAAAPFRAWANNFSTVGALRPGGREGGRDRLALRRGRQAWRRGPRSGCSPDRARRERQIQRRRSGRTAAGSNRAAVGSGGAPRSVAGSGGGLLSAIGRRSRAKLGRAALGAQVGNRVGSGNGRADVADRAEQPAVGGRVGRSCRAAVGSGGDRRWGRAAVAQVGSGRRWGRAVVGQLRNERRPGRSTVGSGGGGGASGWHRIAFYTRSYYVKSSRCGGPVINTTGTCLDPMGI